MSVTDTEMLDFVQANHIDVLCSFALAQREGGDVMWRLRTNDPVPRFVGVCHSDELRPAIRNAMQALAYQPRVEPDEPDWKELCEHVTKALGDLSFECFAVFDTMPPSRETYNRTFDVLEQVRKALASTQRAPLNEAATPGSPL